jgi:hypothetical protein
MKCLYGASALKGLHQKLRQLVRGGFSNSPRFALALLFEYFHRWNHTIWMSQCEDYTFFHDGFDLETEKELVSKRGDKEEAHKEWINTFECEKTRKTFGILFVQNMKTLMKKQPISPM